VPGVLDRPDRGRGRLMQRVPLPAAVVGQITAHARSRPDREVCGLVSALDTGNLQVHAVENVAAQPDVRFEMDPRQQIHALQQVREQGRRLFAIYHSHPRGPDTPSALDRELAAYPEALYLIVAPDAGGVWRLHGYFLGSHGEVEAVELATVE
jgi:proteasome lid subunit RPN8/RPN11